jgi:hypothetical protein
MAAVKQEPLSKAYAQKAGPERRSDCQAAALPS